MGSAAPAEAPQNISIAAPNPEPAVVATSNSAPNVSNEDLRNAVLNALAGQPMLVAMLEGGEWRVDGNEVVVKVAASAGVIDMSISAEAKRSAGAAASGALGRPVKLRVVSGGTAQAATPAPRNGGGRTKAEQDPIVKKMRDKFGAEIRTVIDYTRK
jgi:hypothetical protein